VIQLPIQAAKGDFKECISQMMFYRDRKEFFFASAEEDIPVLVTSFADLHMV